MGSEATTWKSGREEKRTSSLTNAAPSSNITLHQTVPERMSRPRLGQPRESHHLESNNIVLELIGVVLTGPEDVCVAKEMMDC